MKTIKKATVSDIKEFFGGEFTEAQPEEYIRSRADSGYIFCMEIDGNIVSILVYSIWWGNCPFIELIKVNKKYQRQGIGTQLLDAAKKEIAGKGYEKLISSTEVINDMGLCFHKKKGFDLLHSLSLPHGEEQFFTLDLTEQKKA